MDNLKKLRVNQRGVTILELLLVFFIVAIFAMISIMSYQIYATRTRYVEIITFATVYKVGVADCYQQTQSFSTCDAGMNGVPNAISSPLGVVASTSVENGIITITPVNGQGIETSDTYVLTPNFMGQTIVWSNYNSTNISGCIASGLCKEI